LNESARHTVLSNGLTVITKEMRQLPIASFWVWYRVGSRNEAAGTTGISHWVEHMMFQGTPTLGKGDIFRKVSANGGVLNGFTWIDYTAYFETLPSHRLDLSIAIESDRMANSLFMPEEVERERTVIISEREGSENSPHFLLGEELGAAAFAAHPYGHSVIGWKSDLQAMTRDELYRHYQTFYAPNNAIVVAVGDFETAELLEQIQKRFGPIPSGPENPGVRTVEPLQRGERRVAVRYPAGMPALQVGYHAPSASNPDAYPVLVLDAILSGGKSMGIFGSHGGRMGRSSRLYRALVDGGIASNAGSSFSLTQDPYLFDLDATPRPGVTLEQVEKAMFQEVEKLQQELVSREELNRAMKQVRAQLVYGSESVTDQGYWLGAMETIDSYESYGRMLERLERVTPQEVQQVAQQYLTETNRTVGWLIPTEAQGAPAAPETAERAAGQPFFYTPHGPMASGGSSPAGGPPPGISLDVERSQLDNGAVVLCSQDSSLPQVVIRASLIAGSAFDSKSTEGIAHFVAAMLIRGTEDHSFQQLSEETDSLGMGISSDAGRLTAQVGIRSLSEDFPRAMEILSEVLRRPTFPQVEVDKLRSQIISGLREQEMSPRAVAERRFLEEVYPEGHPYRLWPSGNQESANGMTRESLVEFYRRHYRPDRLTIAVVGDVAPDAALAQLNRVLGDWKAEGQAPALEIPPVALPAPITAEVAVPGKFQSEMVMGLPAIPRKDPDYYALRLGNLILGELGLSGRLGANIRDKMGLAYHVSSDLQASVGPSVWAIRAGVNPAGVDRAIEAAREEIERWRTDLVAESEIDDGKSFLIGSLPIALETSDGIARTLLDIEFYQLGLDYLQRYPGLIDGVSRESIRDAVRRWIHPEHLVTVIAGPKRG